MLHKAMKKRIAEPAPVQKELNYPREKDFYILETEEFSGALPPHSVRMSVAFPYRDWCEFEKSVLFHRFSEYLEELQTRDNLNERTDTLAEREQQKTA